ncbi:hypothetical protein ACFQJ7_13125 [Halovenus rubra]|uniref:Uncharacterized protein n=1 Tax=Halovenus rubra TaxID=869890 RepID=A0ABD5X8T7_9EURY
MESLVYVLPVWMHTATSKTEQFWTVQVREGRHFDTVGFPDWAQRIANRISTGARVRLGQPGTDGWLVEVVRLSRQHVPDRDHAEAVDSGHRHTRFESGPLLDSVQTLDATDDGLGETVLRPDGVVIPTGEFRDVIVTVQDAHGDPIPNAEWVRSAGIFPTSGRVRKTEDGSTQAQLWLLPYQYESFALTVRDDDTTHVWHETENSGGVPKDTDEVTLRFERESHGVVRRWIG